jgi:dipeptidyl aminopeptidase/acylaminoacyl peptidase
MPQKRQKTITAEDLYKLQSISSVRMSPDGENIIYTLQRVHAPTEKKYSNLWMVSTRASTSRQFTYGDQNDTAARWSPDGKQISFLSNRGDKEKPPQIYLIPFDGGEARKLTALQGSISSYSWSPDGKNFLCTVRKTDPVVLEREKDEQKKKLGTVFRHYNRPFYKLDGFGYLPEERSHLWIVNATSGRARQLTDHALFDEGNCSWSPDGRWIVFTSNRCEKPDLDPSNMDLFVIPSSGGEFRKITTPYGDKNSPIFSPDGKWIAYYGQEGDQDYKNQNLWLVPANGSAPAQNLTGKFDFHVSSWTINDLGEGNLTPPLWKKDSKRIIFPVLFHGSSMVYSIDTEGKKLETLIGEGGVAQDYSLDKAQIRLAYFYGKMDDPGQICILDLASGKNQRLTHVNRELLDKIDLGKVEEVWFKGTDGNNLQGWILTPPGFDPKKKYPSIMEIHGGPLTQYGNYFMHEFYYLASLGYIVYFSNPRGGRGYGEVHAGAIYGSWGSVDYTDLMAWADFVQQKSYIDPQRMGVTGGSYGGYMTVWIIGHTNRFKAAVTQRCVSNFVSMWGSSDFNWTFQKVLADKPPFEDLQKFWDHSPIKYIGNAKTPTLVIHNEMDLRCPIEQGEQVFIALQTLGVESAMVRFPEEFHGLSRSGRTDRRIARLKHISGWFDKHLKNKS